MSKNSLLEKLDGLVARFEEVSTLITDPSVLSDMNRYVSLNNDFRDLDLIVNAQKEYKSLLDGIEVAKLFLEHDNDPDIREMENAELDLKICRSPS